MPPYCSSGFSFRLRGHLWVVIVELPGQPEKVVAVSLTSKRPDSDTTVVLQSGDHRFIKHDTVVYYADARLFSKSDLISRIELRLFEPDEAFSEEKVKIIQRGLFASPFTPRDIKNLCAVAIGQDQSTTDHECPPSDG